jgi:hypothetical protein
VGPLQQLERVLGIVTEPSHRRLRRPETGRTRRGGLVHNRQVTDLDTAAVTDALARVSDLDPAPVLDAMTADPNVRAFLSDRRVTTMPAKLSRRRLLLSKIVPAFEPGVRYPERAVDAFLKRLYDDHATLRRYLVDEEFLARADGQYWRIADPAPPTPGAPSGQIGRAGRK